MCRLDGDLKSLFKAFKLKLPLFPIILLSAISIFAIYIALMSPFGLPDNLSLAAAIILIAIGSLATGAIPEQLTVLIFFFATMVLTVSSPEIVFSGFNSGAFWLVFGGLIIGAAVEVTGFGRRVAKFFIRHIKGSYSSVVAAVITINCILIFLMPSTLSRVVLLIPIIISLSTEMGFREGSKPRHGLIMATVLTAYLCSTSVLPSNVPNNVLMGASETLLQVPIRYFDYFLLHFPVLGFLKAIIIWGCIVFLFKPKDLEFDNRKTVEESPPESKVFYRKEEKRLLFFLVCALVLWATDAAHGIAPAWVSLAIGILCLFPKIGIVSPSEFKDKVQFSPLLYVAGIIGIGAVVADSGLGAFVSKFMIQASGLSPANPVQGFIVLSGISMFLSFFSTMPGVPAIMVPLAPDLHMASGLPLKTVLMTQVVGFSTVWLPYQVPPIIIGMQLAKVPMMAGIKITALIAVISIILLLPILILWWQVLGYLPAG